MRILTVFNGEYGKRHLENIRQHGPKHWSLDSWRAPRFFPPMIDDPTEFLPEQLPETDLILSFAEHRGAAELLPEIAAQSGAKAVLVAVDDDAWLPRGLENQLHGWLADLKVDCVTPRPLCSLTESSYGVTRHQSRPYQNALIAEFASRFGKPVLELTLDSDSRTITAAEVIRDAVCGCARQAAQELIGLSADEAEQKAGLLHHHYPCLASMQKLEDFDQDTLMHTSGQILKNEVGAQVKPYRKVRYITPGKRSP